MTRTLHIGIAMLVALPAMTGAYPAWATPGEPLVVTQLSDPDPDFVPPPEPKRTPHRNAKPSADPSLEEAMEIVGQATGNAARMAKERSDHALQDIDQQVCNTLKAARGSGIDHSDWERSCGLR
jgi:hypothetical protein